jgi:hypothetical protein
MLSKSTRHRMDPCLQPRCEPLHQALCPLCCGDPPCTLRSVEMLAPLALLCRACAQAHLLAAPLQAPLAQLCPVHLRWSSWKKYSMQCARHAHRFWDGMRCWARSSVDRVVKAWYSLQLCRVHPSSLRSRCVTARLACVCSYGTCEYVSFCQNQCAV